MRSGTLFLASCLTLGACSRPATTDECEFIVRRVAELRLANGLDAAEAREGAEKLTRELESEIRQECVGTAAPAPSGVRTYENRLPVFFCSSRLGAASQ
jgi:hypothetical protein